MLLIGLSGLAGSGKSTASRVLSKHFNIPRRPFAYPLKAMVAALGIPAEVLDGPASVKELPTDRLNGHTVRYACQTLGTDWGRKLMGEDFWVRLWERGLQGLYGCVADDVRFTNEANAIMSRGGIVIRIERAGAGVKGDDAAHAREQIGDVPYTCVVQNNSSPEDFSRALLNVAFWYSADLLEYRMMEMAKNARQQ